MELLLNKASNSNISFFPSKKSNDFYSDYDLLTGLLNKQGFIRQFTDALDQENTDGGVLLLFDIDRLKRINIIHGRMTGDAVLKLLADILKMQADDGDIVCRLSKDKFALALTNTDLKEGFAKSSDIQKRVAKLKLISNNEIVEANVFTTAIPYVRESTTREVLEMATTLLDGTKERRKAKQIPSYLGM
tara:strand:- start:277 stop:843 length:567 start_codon:yes stop_codon:yes gene_type:complete